MPNAPTRLCGPTSTDLAEYLRQVRSVPLLSRAEERDLAEQFQRNGCENARERLICANLRLVVYAAKRYAGMGIPLPDLVEAGNVGLLHAVARFDPARGTRFSTYAMWWIRRSITLALSEHGSLIRIPRGHARALRACRDAAQSISANLGRPATIEEVAQSAGVPVATAGAAEAARGRSSIVGGEQGALSMGSIGDRRTGRPDDVIGSEEVRHKLRAGLRSLPSQEAEIVRLHFGLGCRSALTVGDISRELGLPRAVVARLLQAALKRLELLVGVEAEGSRRRGSRDLVATG